MSVNKKRVVFLQFFLLQKRFAAQASEDKNADFSTVAME